MAPHTFTLALFAAFALAAVATAAVAPDAAAPVVTLRNAANKGVTMPWIGLGTGGYNSNRGTHYGKYPECWMAATCDDYVEQAVQDWIAVGGRRLDCANSYNNQASVGKAIKKSGVKREELFILSKVGPSFPLGYQDALSQFEQVKTDLQTDYVDLLLIHWPYQNPSQGNVTNHTKTSSDPACQFGATYDATKCRLDTWRALVEIWRAGGARAIGVSNYNHTHINEIVDAGLPLPALTQNPYHIYRSWSQQPTIDLCNKLGITFLGYSPLGVPDWHSFPNKGKYNGTVMSPNQLEDPAAIEVAQYLGITPAQALLAWQWQAGIPVNPRSQNKQHMVQNLEAYKYKLSTTQMDTLSHRPQAWCSVDPKFYECAPDKPTVQ